LEDDAMKIGTLARRTGLNASAIRYYEKMGLLAAPHRTGGQRHYSEETVPRVLLIRFTSEMGFTLGEIKLFLSGLRDDQPIGPRWRKFATRKIEEVDRTIERSLKMKTLFQNLLKCRCASLKVCVGCLSLNEDLNPKKARRNGTCAK
jgi:MerR family redox-sensitive transcriptional activator SoxR